MIVSLFLYIVFSAITFSSSQDIVFTLDRTSGENKKCTTSENDPGLCTPLSECPHVWKKIKDTNYQPKHCGFVRSTPVVCCPKIISSVVDIRVNTTSSDEIAPPEVNFRCGIRELEWIAFRRKRSTFTSIPSNDSSVDDFADQYFEAVGGFETKPHSWPWMAIFGVRVKSGVIQWFCDGVLINEQWILTAGHCFLNNPNFFVRLGEHDHSDTSGNSPRRDYEVETKIFHPDFSSEFGYFDLGLLKLTETVEIMDAVRPVCLPWGPLTGANFVGENVTLTGWGTTQYGGLPSDVLIEAYVTIFDAASCHDSYSGLLGFRRDWPQGMNSENVLCAGSPEGGIDACQGDSGGPLVLGDSDEVYTLVGIISQGHGCGLKDFPGLYAPVSKELGWIKEIAFKELLP